MSNIENTKDYTKLTLYKEDGFEIVIDEKTGECFASTSAVARMCNVNESSIRKFKKLSALIDLKNARIHTSDGIKSSALLTEESILKCIAKYNPELLIKFAQLGLRKFLHTNLNFKVKQQTKSLYPDRSLEYKELYNELKELLKKTNAGKHHYIELNRNLNKVVGKIEGRSNNTITEVENLAYCLLMRKTLKAGNTFLNKVNNYTTREAINKQLLILEPQIKSIQEALQVFE